MLQVYRARIGQNDATLAAGVGCQPTQCVGCQSTASAAAPIVQVKVHAFRISEAKEVLTQLGLPKHGRKEELHARILTIFQDAATL